MVYFCSEFLLLQGLPLHGTSEYMQKSISLLLGWYYKVLGITHYKVTHHCNHITFVRDIVMLPIIVHPVTLLLHGKRYRRIRCLISRLQNSVFTQAETPELNAPPYGIVFLVYSCCSIKRQQLAVWCTNLFCKMTIKLSKTSEIFREEEDTSMGRNTTDPCLQQQ